MLFKDRDWRRLVRQILRPGGLAVALAATAVIVVARGPVYADILAPVQQAFAAFQQRVAQETTVDFTPSPSPSPSPTPGPGGPGGPGGAYQPGRGGAIHYLFSGSLAFGTTVRDATFGSAAYGPLSPIGPSASPSPSASPLFPLTNASQNNTEAGAGMLAEVSRRTSTTFTDIKIPIGFSSAGYQGGVPTAIYSTPKYSIAYGSQQLVSFGQLPLGSTLRGVSLILPTRFGQDIFYEGPALGADGELLRLEGVLAQAQLGSNFYEAGFTYGSGNETGNSKTLIFGGATGGSGPLSLSGEGAWQDRTGGDGDPHGVAFQLHLEDTLPTTGIAATLRSVPDQFVAFGSGEVNGDRYFDTNYHTGSSNSLYADANWERTGDSTTGIAEQRVLTLTASGQSAKYGGFTLGLIQQNGTFTGGADVTPQSQDTSGVQTQVSEQFHQLQMTFAAQLQRSIASGIPSSTRSFGVDFTRQFGLLAFSLQTLDQRQTQEGIGVTLQTGASLSVSRQIGKTTYAFSDSATHTISPTSDATQQTPLLAVTRQISPVISVQVSGGYSRLHDILNPGADGSTKIFSVQLNAPFSFGNGLTTGRADPRLPATIAGRVQLAPRTTNSGGFAGFAGVNGGATGGLGNVVVNLDGRYVQRTDLTGGFQFSFLPPGQHQLRVESSSLPHGLTVQTPIITITIDGGQTAQVLFSVGNYAGILGHVYGIDQNGKKLALQNVKLQIDGAAYSQTDTTGAYGFGGLTPGKHTVQVVESSIPAFASFDPVALKQSVTVSDGQYTTLDFSAQPLGSIAGRIIYGADVAKDALTGGVLNAYVVAEPGEHAAIDENDGSFVIDNLPPGDYTVSVDPETLVGGFGAQPDSISVHLGPGEHYDDAAFTVGRFEKKVVFSLLSGNATASAPVVSLSERRLPPLGSTVVTVDAPESAGSVTLVIFEQHLPLVYDKAAKVWTGQIAVPATAKAGDYSVDAGVASGTAPASATLKVDPRMPLALLQYTPKNATVGQTVAVRARFLVDARAGDKIEWEDGTVTTLGKPIAGRVFTFNLRISLRPLHGVLLTRQGRLPIELM
jgi:hypothetical protein